ncbi:MAG: sodium/proline symporter [Steroidobacteraceae bacterium]
MEARTAALMAIGAYCLVMLGIGAWAASRTNDQQDFFLGGRRLGPMLAALSQGATQSSAWTLVGVSGAAYAWGLSAVWIWLSVVAGYAVNWGWVAPRLRRLSLQQGSLTLVQLLAGTGNHREARLLRQSASLVIVVSFLFYAAAQFQAAGAAFAVSLDLDLRACILVGALLIIGYTLVGGFWAATVSDGVQACLMLVVALGLPIAGLVAVGGPMDMLALLGSAGPQQADWLGGREGVAALAFVLGTFGIGLAAPGQPHVVNHFMAARDDDAIRRGGWIALAWIAVILAGMLVVGWCARALNVADPESVIYQGAAAWLPPAVGGIVAVAVMSAIMSTADSQIVTATSSLTVDLKGAHRPDGGAQRLLATRLALVGFGLAAAAVALFAPASIYSRVLFAWNALGAAFGPLVLLAVAGRPCRPAAALAGLWTGFLLTVALYLAPNAEGDVLERVLPFVVALGISLLADRRARARRA